MTFRSWKVILKIDYPKMNKKQQIILGIGALVLFLGIGASWLFWWGRGENRQSNVNQGNSTPTQVQALPTLSDIQKPEIGLEINDNRSGAVLTISKIDSDFTELEYELIYLAESDDQEIERGVAGGPIEIDDSREVSEDLLFGTESCTTGVCKQRIDKNVSGGTLTIRLTNADNQSWEIEKEFTIEESASGYNAVFTTTAD